MADDDTAPFSPCPSPRRALLCRSQRVSFHQLLASQSYLTGLPLQTSSETESFRSRFRFLCTSWMTCESTLKLAKARADAVEHFCGPFRPRDLAHSAPPLTTTLRSPCPARVRVLPLLRLASRHPGRSPAARSLFSTAKRPGGGLHGGTVGTASRAGSRAAARCRAVPTRPFPRSTVSSQAPSSTTSPRRPSPPPSILISARRSPTCTRRSKRVRWISEGSKVYR